MLFKAGRLYQLLTWGALFLSVGFLTSPALCAPSPKALFRFAQISDDHYMMDGPDGSWRLLQDAPNLLQDALQQINSAGKVQMVLFTGNFVNVPTAETFKGFFNLLQQNTKIPSYFVLGSHDVGTQPEQNKSATLQAIQSRPYKGFTLSNLGYYSFSPVKQLQIIVLDGTTDEKLTLNGFIPEEELTWLKKELTAAKDKAVIIVSHFPVVEPYSSSMQRIVEPDSTKLLTLLESSPNVVAVLSGHYHAARMTKRNGIYHISAPSLVEYPNGFRIFTVYSDGSLRAEWKATQLKELQDKSRLRSPWVSNANGDPKKDHSFNVKFRFFPK